MMLRLCALLLLTIRPIIVLTSSNIPSSLEFILEAKEFFKHENELLRQRKHSDNLASYKYNTNVTDDNRREMVDVLLCNALKNKELAEKIRHSGYQNIDDKTIQREVNLLSDLGSQILPEEEYKLLQDAISNMQANYAKTTVCAYKDATKCGLQLEPYIQERLANSRDPDELRHYWTQWYDLAGTPMKENFAKYVQLTRKAAQLNNYTSNAEYWIHFYEDTDFEKNLDNVFKTILPFYEEIHAYVRYRLRQHYGEDVVSERGNIPMHLLGNLWAQQWDNVMDLYAPYPEEDFIDVTFELRRQNYTVTKMFELGDEFFRSLGMIPLPKSFWNLSVLERPNDVDIVCHASAWDFYEDSDVRIKMCTEVSMYYLYVVHHELGHIQYYLQYELLPTAFRRDPNPGFHEAVGDVIALSVSSPRHLKRIGLSSVSILEEKKRLNELFKTALKKVAFLPFAYTMDKYRYAVFRGEIAEDKWNCEFWKMRSELSGIEPPVIRTERDFDPTAKYHIDADVEYLRYFAAHIFQFQFHKSLCIKAGQYSPDEPDLTLDNCDIFNSKQAGKAFSQMLSRGASKHWKETLFELTGEYTMNPSALLEYFKPLRLWLQEEIKRLDIPLGWEMTDKITAACL